MLYMLKIRFASDEAEELKEKISNQKEFKIISVIENIYTKLPFDVDFKIPLSEFEIENFNFKKDEEYIVVCNKGISSYIATERIKKLHQDLNVRSLENGITKF